MWSYVLILQPYTSNYGPCETKCLDPGTAARRSPPPVQPRGLIWVRSFTQGSQLQPKWKGPFQILLITQTTIKIAKRDVWIHWSHVKSAAFDHSSEFDVRSRIPPVKLKINPETDEWTWNMPAHSLSQLHTSKCIISFRSGNFSFCDWSSWFSCCEGKHLQMHWCYNWKGLLPDWSLKNLKIGYTQTTSC